MSEMKIADTLRIIGRVLWKVSLVVTVIPDLCTELHLLTIYIVYIWEVWQHDCSINTMFILSMISVKDKTWDIFLA